MLLNVTENKRACNCTKTDTCMNEIGRSVNGQTFGGGVWEARPVVITHQCEMLHSPFSCLKPPPTQPSLTKSCLQRCIFLGWLKCEMDPSVMTRPPHQGGLEPTIMLQWIKVDGLLGQRHQRLLRCHTTTDDAKMHTCTMCDQYGL